MGKTPENFYIKERKRKRKRGKEKGKGRSSIFVITRMDLG